MEDFWFRLKLALAPLGGFFGGLLLVWFLEKVAHLPFYAWQEKTIGAICAILALYLFCKKIDKNRK